MNTEQEERMNLYIAWGKMIEQSLRLRSCPIKTWKLDKPPVFRYGKGETNTLWASIGNGFKIGVYPMNTGVSICVESVVNKSCSKFEIITEIPYPPTKDAQFSNHLRWCVERVIDGINLKNKS